jgi:RPA family protein
MSQSQSQSQPQRNEAVRMFADEFNEASIEFQEQGDVDDEDGENSRAPKYHLLPSGGCANRVLMMGTVTEIDQVSESPITLRAKIVDQTGSFFTYAGKYNPDEVSYLQNLEAPEHVMVVGKPNTYTTDEGDTYVSVEPENITVVEKATRDRWTAEAAVQTLDRVDAFRKGEAPYGNEADQYYDFDHEDFVKDIKEIGTEIINENTDKTDSAAQPQAPSA